MVQILPTCRSCGSDEVVSLSLVVAGSSLRFTCCYSCELTAWESDGRTVPLRSVLELASSAH